MTTTEPPNPIFGPLTTRWTMPNSCLTTMATVDCYKSEDCSAFIGYAAQVSTFTQVYYYGTSPSKKTEFKDYLPTPDPACWAPNMKSDNFTGGLNTMYHSPGLVCPVGYTTACITTAGKKDNGGWRPALEVASGEVAAGCCPSDYTCTGTESAQLCVSTMRDTTWTASLYNYVGYYWAAEQYMTVTLPHTYDGISMLKSISENTIYAPMIQLRRKTTDAPLDASGSTIQPTPTGGPSASATNPSTTDESSSSNESPSARGLSTGAKAGVGVGVGLAGLLLLGALAWFLTKYRRRRLADEREARASDLPVKETTTRATAGPPPMPGLQHGDLGSPQQPGSWRDSIGAFHQAPTSGKQG